MSATVRRIAVYLVAPFLCLAAADAGADEVTDLIDQARRRYEAGDLAAAAGYLEFAAQKIKEKKGERLKALLPSPLEGWSAGRANVEVAGAALLGGGVSARREYTKGASAVTVTIVADSPLLQGVVALYNSPLIAASAGAKIEMVAGQRAIVQMEQPDRGKLDIVVANRYLVSVEGRGTTKDVLTRYAAAVDYRKLAALP